MRYVIGVCLFTGFLVWDAMSNDGRFLEASVREARHLMSFIGG